MLSAVARLYKLRHDLNYTRINIDQDRTGSIHSATAATQVFNNRGWDIQTMVTNGTLIVEQINV